MSLVVGGDGRSESRTQGAFVSEANDSAPRPVASGRMRVWRLGCRGPRIGKDPAESITKRDVQTETSRERRVDEVVRWRREQLAETGFSLALAAEVASDARYDVHALIELVERGCRPELAARILAPLEPEPDTA
jgi:hypothetical protein